MKEDIAIIGVSCKLPGAGDYDKFWENLEKGINSIQEIPPERWDTKKYYSPDINASNKSISKWCGLLDQVDHFDHKFFQISPREAKQMDPQQRLLMEQTKLCILDAGVPLSSLQTKKTSVHVGVMSGDYLEEVTKQEYDVDSYTGLGNIEAILANRISYTFGLSGVSSVSNGACASSLLAVHEAKSVLQQGESDYALASGVNLNLHPWKYISFSKSRMLSPDGQCKTFDKDANGYVPGDGVGVLLLQRLSDALRDGNQIYGIVKGSAVNHGGRALSMTAPRIEAQKEVILSAYKDAEINPETITYWEAHGTGTSLGDPIEVESATQAVREYSDKTGYCHLGSVKTNIGHLESAAGMAGIIKILMMMRHKKIPQTLNIQTLNPMIQFSRTPFIVADRLSEWKKSELDKPYRASVSSFGFGGVNSHVIIEEFTGKHVRPKNSGKEKSQLFELSAKNEKSLQDMISIWQSFVNSSTFEQTPLEDICKTQLISRGQYAFRCASLVKNKNEITTFLKKAKEEIYAVSNKSWTLYIGDLKVNGFELIEGLMPHLNEIFPHVRALGGDKLWRRFRREKWKSKEKLLFSILIGYMMSSALNRLGFSPQIVSGEKTGIYLSLVLSGMISLDNAIGVISGDLCRKDIQLKRPTVPFFDPVRMRVIVPYRFTADYLRKLCDKKEIDEIPESLFNDSVKKALSLETSQYTFKRNLQEWNKSLITFGYDVKKLFNAEKMENSERWLLLTVISCSMNKLNQKWDLPEQYLWDDPYFQEWVSLIESEVLPQELAVELLVGKAPNYEKVGMVLEDRQNKLNRIERMPLLKEFNQTVSEIDDVSSWIEACLSTKPALQLNGSNLLVLGNGDEKITQNAASVCDFKEGIVKSWEGLLKDLWLQGVNLDWQELYSEGTFLKVSLPGYSFNRIPLRLSTSKKFVEVKTDMEDLLHSNSTNSSPMEQNNQTNQVESEENRQMNALYEQTEVYLKGVLAKELQVSLDEIETDIRFEEYGIDSLLIHHFNHRMEQDIGSIPKTLLFECENLNELTEYVVDNHSDQIICFLGLETINGPTDSREELMSNVDVQDSVRVDDSSVSSEIRENDIAIIGVSGRYPSARNLDEFWGILRNGQDTVTEVPQNRWKWQDIYDPDPNKSTQGKSYSKWGAFLDDVDKFDPLFFNIAPTEAETMDPQERLFIETAWATLEDAGYTPDQLRLLRRGELSSNVGVFVGVTTYSYLLWGPELWKQDSKEMTIPTSLPWSIANRVSYLFNFDGPSMPVDTACSSSLTAIHLACESIKKGECSTALVGGVNLYLHPSKYVWLSQMRMLSETGRCHSFGANGNGFVPGEGVGALLLKPLSEAVRDGDQVYGVIKGTSINHGGRTNGYTVPNPKAQAELIGDALKKAKFDPRTISYLEAHGTGTSLGDPIEVTGLAKAFNKDTEEKQYCALGSVKSNIGHLEAAAGIAGITKILLQMKYKQLVPSLHAEELNPNISFEETPFYVQQKLKDWKQPVMDHGQVVNRRAGISSFGAGGSNAHVVLEEYVASPEHQRTSRNDKHLVVLSSKTQDQLYIYARELVQYLASHKPVLEDVAYTLQTGRVAMNERLAIEANSLDELQSKLTKYLEGVSTIEGVYRGTAHKLNHKTKRKKEDKLQELLRGRDASHYGKDLLKSLQLDRLAAFWVLGGMIEWKDLYKDLDYSPHRISLPTYPFACERYWIPNIQSTQINKVQKNEKQQPLHTLVTKNISTLEAYKFMTVIHGDEFFIADHYVGTSRVLPGVVTVEMVRAAAELVGERKVRKVRNNVLISPIYVKEEPVTLFISLVPNGEILQYEIYSNDASGTKVLHGQGKVEYELAHHSQEPAEWLDIEAIKARCTKEYRSKMDSYRHLHSIELNLRESFQSIEGIYLGENEAIAPVQLPEHLKNDFLDYILHPSLMDGSLQVPPAGEMRGVEEIINLPYTIEEVEIIRPLTERCYSISKLALTKNGEKPKVPKFNVDITDEQGRVLVKVKGFLARPIDPVDFMDKNVVSAGLQWNKYSKEGECAAFKPVWQKETLTAPVINTNGSILIFDMDTTLWDKLKYQGPVILVQPGDSFVQLEDRRYKLNPAKVEDFHSLMVELGSLELLPNRIVYLWGNTGMPFDEAAISSRLQSTIYTLLYLSQAIVKQKPKELVQLLHVYPAQGLQVEPLLGATVGAARTLRLENPKLCYQTISVDESTPTLTVIQNEISNKPEAGIEVRYYQKERWVKRFKMFDMDQEIIDKQVWKENGVYLITGGLGGLGVIFAEHIAKQVPKAKLVLTGRSPLKGKRKDNLQALRNQGIDAHYIQADISQRTAVTTLIQTIKQRFGMVNGVLHSAGVIRDAFFIRKVASEMEEVLAPKVFGTLWLDEALSNEPIDFFVMFSSSTSVLGNLGQFDYAYANYFMDLFAEWREARRLEGLCSGKNLAINWPLWRGGGMHVDDQSEDLLFQRLGMKAMSTNWGLHMFEKGLSHEGSQFMLIEGDPNKTKQILESNEQQKAVVLAQGQSETLQPSQVVGVMQPTMHTFETIEKTEEYSTNRWIDSLIQDLIKQISELLKVPTQRIRAEDELNDYGFDSIKFIDFTNALNKQYGTDLTPAVFFEYPTIESFAEYLVEDYSEEIGPHYTSLIEQEPVKEQFDGQSGLTNAVSKNGETNSNYYAISNDSLISNKVNQKISESKEQINDMHISVDMVPTDSVKSNVSGTKEPIAIIGMGGVLPQSDDLDEFWKNLIEGVDCITEIPSDRWDWRDYLGDPVKELKKTNSKWGGFIRDVDKFDAKFFGISPREADLMDPQQRILIETVWKTIEDAGYKVSDLSRIKTGLYVGASTNDYMELLKENDVDIQAYTTTGNFHSILVNRISYLFNFCGPSFPIDTACSSSLVAIRQAVEGLWNGSCDVAVVAGVNLILTPTIYISFGKAGMLSSDGRCKTFDKSANGYVRSEGAGAILLKPLSKAIEDNDNIYSVIRGTAVNHGGKVNTLTTPNPNAQADLIVSAFEEGDIDPATVNYMEAHGTGTSLGDPIEINGLKKAFKKLAKRRGSKLPEQAYCGIGSVKTNIGHLEPAAGMSGLLKILLAMKHKTLPASINLSEQNPYIQLDGSPFYIVKEAQPWKPPHDQQHRNLPRRAGVSSFGFGGVNAHVILEEYQQPKEMEQGNEPQLFVFSAKSRERLDAYARKWLDFLKKEEVLVASSSTRKEDIEGELVQLAAKVINVNDKEIYTDEPLVEIGFDPVNLSILLGHINQQYQINLSNNKFTGYPTIEGLASIVAENAIENPNNEDNVDQVFSLRNMAYTLQVGREEMEERIAFVASNREELMEKLTQHINHEVHDGGIYTGNVASKQHRNVEQLLEGIEGEQFLQNILSEKKWDKIAQLWVSGIKIDWNLLHKEQSIRRVPLPTYPFARDRHWFKKSKQAGKIEQTKIDLVPIKDKRIETHRALHRQDKMIRDHIIDGKPIFPGVGYLEMVYSAAKKVVSQKTIGLEQVVWLKPLVVNDSQIIRIVLSPQEEGRYKFIVQSNLEEQQPITHATGYVTSNSLLSSQPEHISIQAVIERTRAHYPKKTIYQFLQQRGLDYGHYFQGIHELWVSEKEAVARLQLPKEYVEELDTYQLQPTLMDSALQTIAGQVIYQDNTINQTILPFAVDRVEWLRPLQAESYVYVKALENGRFDVFVTDSHGQVAVRMMDVMIHVLGGKNRESINLDNFFYKPTWSQHSLAPHEKQLVEIKGSNNVLIIGPKDTHGLEQAIAKHFEVGSVHKLDLNGITNWVETLGSVTQPDVIYYLGGIQMPQEGTNGCYSLEALKERQENGVVGLYHLIRAMSRLQWTEKVTVLKVITNDVYALHQRERIQPLSAGIFGLTMSIAKEYRNLQVSCIDITLLDSITSQITDILVEPPHPNGEAIAIRKGKRYVLEQHLTDLTPVSTTAFRRRGVYLIIGGAGGIGLTLSKYLAEKVQACLILIGRSALNEQQKRELNAIEAAGSEVMYYRADITKPESLRKAKEAAIERFGKIHGVIHAALVLKDSTLDWMDEDSFRNVLRPKVEGTMVLHDVFSGEKLDFMLFFSSAQSYTGSSGQSNYAAACTFADAYARFIEQCEEYPVHIINWGFWGSVGVVATPEYRKSLAEQGIYSINPTEGMEALERILVHSPHQILAIKAESKVIEEMNGGVTTPVSHVESTVQRLEVNGYRNLNQNISLLVKKEESIKAFKELTKISQLFILDFFRGFDFFLESGERYEIKELRRKMSIADEYHRQFDALLSLLKKSGFVTRDGNFVISTPLVEDTTICEMLNLLDELIQQIIHKYPEVTPHLRLLQKCMGCFPEVLQGAIRSTDIIFPNSSTELVEKIYQGSYYVDYCNQLVAQSVKAFIQEKLPQLKPGEKIKILEVGAGTGGTSNCVFEEIKAYELQVEYVYTDISIGFAQFGKRKFGGKYRFVDFKTLDVNKDITTQGFAKHDFDIAIAANVLHATSNVRHSLSTVQTLLKPQGCLLLNEVTEVQEFHTLTFGLLSGWWLFEDEEVRMQDSPLLSPHMWEEVLHETGFEYFAMLSGYSNSSEPLSQNVMVAQAIVDNDENYKHDTKLFIQKTIVEQLAGSLGMNPEDIDLKQEFSSYGVDSIVSVELVNQINESLGIVLRTITIFDYPNIKELTEFIYENFADELTTVQVKPEEHLERIVHAEVQATTDQFVPTIEIVEVQQPVQTVSSDDIRNFIENTTINQLAVSLGADPKEIDINKDFSSYGVDSIVGVELINRLNEEFGILLRTIVIYDHSNVKELTRFIYEEFEGKIASYMQSEPVTLEQSDKENDWMDLLDKLETGELDLEELNKRIGG